MGNIGFIFQVIFFTLSSFGGLIFWLLKGLKTKISYEFEKKYLIRNILTSISISLIGFWVFQSNKPIEKDMIPEEVVLKLIPKNGGYVLENVNGDTVLSVPTQN